MLRRARRCRCNCLTRFFESGAGRALLALLQIIGRFPLSREWGGGGVLVFFWSVCGLFVVAFLFFRFRFFTLTFFSHSHSPHTPHSRESGNLPVMPAEGGGFTPSALNWEIPAFAGMERRVGMGERGEGREIGGVEKMWKRCGEWFFGGRKKIKKNCQFGIFFADCV